MLSTFVAAEFIKTNGLEILKDTGKVELQFVKERRMVIGWFHRARQENGQHVGRVNVGGEFYEATVKITGDGPEIKVGKQVFGVMPTQYTGPAYGINPVK